MDWNLFIIPLTAIFVQLLKGFEVDRKLLPLLAVITGGVLGFVFAISYNQDYIQHIVSGIIYGASASGIYDVVASNKAEKF